MPFTDAERLNAIQSCRFCPMCHHVDLVTTVTRRETTSPRGRGLLLWQIEKGKIGWDAQIADVMYKFSADGLSRRVCAGHIPHDDLILDARRRLLEAGSAPASVTKVRQNLREIGNPWGRPEPDLPALAGVKGRAAGGTEVLFYFGPAARVHRPSTVPALAKIARKAGVAFAVLPSEGDAGLLLHQLGDVEGAREASATLRQKIETGRFRQIVTPDPDAYRTLRAGFGDVPPLTGIEVLHAAEWLDRQTRAKGLRFRPQTRKAAYHDPCALARFAPCLDVPRAVIRTITDAPPLELPGNRDLAPCSGECGGLPFTNADIASAAAARRLEQAKSVGAEILVTASPAAAAALSEANASAIEVKDIVELAADSLVD